jgi:hypothetical protein
MEPPGGSRANRRHQPVMVYLIGAVIFGVTVVGVLYVIFGGWK